MEQRIIIDTAFQTLQSKLGSVCLSLDHVGMGISINPSICLANTASIFVYYPTTKTLTYVVEGKMQLVINDIEIEEFLPMLSKF